MPTISALMFPAWCRERERERDEGGKGELIGASKTDEVNDGAK
jgi:hypothetical protein